MARHDEAHDPSGFRPGKTVSEQASGVVPLAFCLLDWSRQAKGMRAILNRWFQLVAKVGLSGWGSAEARPPAGATANWPQIGCQSADVSL